MPYITSQQFTSEITKKAFSPVYVFAGEDSYDHDEALKALEKTLSVDSLNREVFFGNESKAEEVIIAAQTVPFLGDKRLIIVKNTHKFRANEAEKLAEFIRSPVDSTCLVLLWQDRVAKETKKKLIFQAAEISGTIVEFKRHYDNELPAWVQKKAAQRGKKIDLSASQLLVQESGSTLLELSNEIEKLVLFTGKKGEITVEDVEAVSGHTKTANLNRLAEVLELRDLAASLKVIEELLNEGEEPIKILYRLHWVIRRFLMAKSLLDEEKEGPADVRQTLRLNAFFDRSFFQNLRKFSRKDLESYIGLVLKADLELKTSARPPEIILNELMFALCGERVYQS
jgi:DNA polymerase-3 subunit delta